MDRSAHVILYSRDMARMRTFYERLGFTTIEGPPGATHYGIRLP